MLDLTDLPNFCARERWGSIDAVGQFPGGFRADDEPDAVPTRSAGLLDILFDPYFMSSHDATSVEMAVGSSLFTRELLAAELMRQMDLLGLNTQEAERVATDLLHNNAARVYGMA